MASWRTTYRGLLPDELLAGLSVEARAEQWRRQLEPSGAAAGNAVIYVVEDVAGLGAATTAPRIVGFASAGPEREPESGFDGELYAIYLLAEHQGAGIGRELVRSAAAFLRERGFTSMRVWVLAGNAAEGFYQRMGGERVGEKPITVGAVEYREIAYGWRSLGTIQ